MRETNWRRIRTYIPISLKYQSMKCNIIKALTSIHFFVHMKLFGDLSSILVSYQVLSQNHIKNSEISLLISTIKNLNSTSFNWYQITDFKYEF